MVSHLTIKERIQKDYERKVKTFLSLPIEGQNVMIGDSMIAYMNVHTFGFHDWINQGIAGDTTDGVLNRLHAVTRLHPQRIIISIGSNDLVLTNHSHQKIMENLQAIVSTLSKHSEVYLCMITPINPYMKHANHAYIAGRTNASITMLNQRMSELFHDIIVNVNDGLMDEQGYLNEKLSKDGIHLNQEGYYIFVESLRKRLSIKA